MQFIKQDITTVVSPAIIAHGVNCQRAMGSGVAKALYTKWPIVRQAYLQRGSQVLGDVQCLIVEPHLIVANCFTQEYYGRAKNVKYASADAIAASLGKLAMNGMHRTIYGNLIHIPRIASDRGGLDWATEVLPVLEAIEQSTDVEFVVHDL